MTYMQVFAAPVSKARRQEYIDHASRASQVFMDHGVISYRECWAADVPDGELTSFPLAVQTRDDEEVVVGWAEWPSREVCDEGMPKVMEDPRMAMQEMPFDGKRLIFGGFDVVVER